MQGLFDLIIIGAGPAGITAAVYAARKRMNFIVVTKDIGGQTAWSGEIENYTGYQFITGAELTAKFEEHTRTYNFNMRENEAVTGIEKDGGTVRVTTEKATYRAKTAIVASGKRSRQLGVPGEKEFRNKGLAYCATCDAPLFSGKDVAVIGGGNSALEAALQLMKIANRIHIVNNAPALTGDEVMREKVEASDKVTVMNGNSVAAVLGEKFVTGLRIKSGSGETTIPVQGVFVEIGLLPNADFAAALERNAKGEIKVDSYNRTSLGGVFAAGDVTDVPEKQIIIAAGEGAKAALGAFRYLSTRR